MSMPGLELDFLRRGRRPGWAAWTLLVVAIAFAADLGWSWHSLRMEIRRKEAQVARSPQARSELLRVSARQPRDGELAAARATLRRLSVPWDALFAALEAAQSDRAWLLSVEPDVQNSTLTLTGEARDYLAALSYVANLEQQKILTKVHLTKHETRQNDPQRPLAFVISASWRERP